MHVCVCHTTAVRCACRIKLSDFKFRGMIGKGTFGKVYIADYPRDNKVYAVKIIEKAAIRKVSTDSFGEVIYVQVHGFG